MSKATSLIGKLDSILNKFGPFDRIVYKRVITASGVVDSLIGRYSGSETHVDTVLDPQPYYERIGRQHIPGGHAQSMDILVGSKQLLADDYEFIISPTSMSLADLQDSNTLLVLKNDSGDEEELRLMDVEKNSLQGERVLYTAYYRSQGRPQSQ